MGALLLVVVVVVVVAWWMRREGEFTAAFAALLDNPVTGRRGLGAFLSGREHVGGEFGGRPVVLTLHRKRGRHSLGYLVVAIQPRSPAGPASSSAPHLWDLVRAPAGREALSILEKRHELRMEYHDGWLRATWMPVGFFVFPGRFDEGRWRAVLGAMQQVADSIEGGAGGA